MSVQITVQFRLVVWSWTNQAQFTKVGEPFLGDDKQIAQLVRQHLEEAGYEVLTAVSIF